VVSHAAACMASWSWSKGIRWCLLGERPLKTRLVTSVGLSLFLSWSKGHPTAPRSEPDSHEDEQRNVDNAHVHPFGHDRALQAAHGGVDDATGRDEE
jgi:hypothetical protein